MELPEDVPGDMIYGAIPEETPSSAKPPKGCQREPFAGGAAWAELCGKTTWAASTWHGRNWAPGQSGAVERDYRSSAWRTTPKLVRELSSSSSASPAHSTDKTEHCAHLKRRTCNNFTYIIIDRQLRVVLSLKDNPLITDTWHTALVSVKVQEPIGNPIRTGKRDALLSTCEIVKGSRADFTTVWINVFNFFTNLICFSSYSDTKQEGIFFCAPISKQNDNLDSTMWIFVLIMIMILMVWKFNHRGGFILLFTL